MDNVKLKCLTHKKLLAFAINPRITDSAKQIWNLKQLAALAATELWGSRCLRFSLPFLLLGLLLLPLLPLLFHLIHPKMKTHPASYPRWQYLRLLRPKTSENRNHFISEEFFTFIILSVSSPWNVRISTLIWWECAPVLHEKSWSPPFLQRLEPSPLPSTWPFLPRLDAEPAPPDTNAKVVNKSVRMQVFFWCSVEVCVCVDGFFEEFQCHR